MQPHHQTYWDFHSSWSCIEWWSGDRWHVTCDRWNVTGDICFQVEESIKGWVLVQFIQWWMGWCGRPSQWEGDDVCFIRYSDEYNLQGGCGDAGVSACVRAAPYIVRFMNYLTHGLELLSAFQGRWTCRVPHRPLSWSRLYLFSSAGTQIYAPFVLGSARWSIWNPR